MSARRALITGSGSYHPERCVPNAFFDARFGDGVGDWLVENVNIHQRYWAADDESTADMAAVAAERALADAGVAPEAVDLLIVATDTPEYLSPSTASVVCDRLGLAKAGSFDLNTACTGFVTALDMAAKDLLVETRHRHVLVVGAYAMSKFLNPDDKKTATLFADGAAGVVLSAGEAPEDAGRGYVTADLETQGRYHDWMGVYAGGSRYPITPERVAAHQHQLAFTRRFPKELNPLTWTRMVQAQCARLGVSPGDVDHYFFTQLNIHAIHETLDNLGVPRERGHTVMDRVGYTGSACIPMALHDAWSKGRIAPGERLMFVASGGGLTFAAATFIA